MTTPQIPKVTSLDQIYWENDDLIIGNVRLKNAKIDSLHIEPSEGKQIVGQWQGLGETLDV